MINISALVQLKAFARQDGLIVCLLWAVSFLLVVYQPASSWGSLLAISTPIVVYWLLRRFRNYALEGTISFRRALAYGVHTFFYASMAFCFVQYVFLRFFDHGSFLAMLQQNVAQIEQAYQQAGTNATELVSSMRQSIDVVSTLSPIELAFIFMMQNIFIGSMLSLPIAIAGRRSAVRNIR